MSVHEQIVTMAHLSQSAAAWLCGLSARTFRDTDCPRLPDGTYDARAVLTWATNRAAVDPLLAGDSPALERYREARAGMAELDLQERQGNLLPRAGVRLGMTRLAGLLRRLGEHLGRRHGPEAATALNDALDEFEAIARSEFGEGGDDGTPQ